MAKKKKTKNTIEKFISEAGEDVLSCPNSITSFKDNFAKMKPYLGKQNFLSQADKKYFHLYERGMCEAYKNMTNHVQINVEATCQDLKKIITYVDEKVNSSKKPTLLLIGEYHTSAESFLIEIAIFTYLKEKKLSSKILIELSSEGAQQYKNLPLSSFLALDARHFAHHVLNYDLVGIDKHHIYYAPTLASIPVREKGMKSKIESIVKNSPDKVNVATLGYAHLAPFKILEQDPVLNVIILNAARPSKLERELSAGNHINESKEKIAKRYEIIDSIKVVGINSNIESLTFRQVLELFKACQTENNLNSNKQNYIFSKGIEDCEMLNDNYFLGCDASANTEL